MNEKIICAANWYPELEFDFNFSIEIPKTQYLPKNCSTGIVFSGHRHLQCQRQMNVVTGKRAAETKEIKGFLTNQNRFVTRKEAAIIATREGQLNNRTIGSVEILFSEDLY